MLDPALLRDRPDVVRDGLRKRGAAILLEPILELDARRRSLLVEGEGLKKTRNESSRTIGVLVKQGADPAALKEETRRLGARIAELEKEVALADEHLQEQLRQIPNVPHESVREGTGAEDNPVVRTWGEPRSFPFEPKAHWDLGPAPGIIDFERAAKKSG